MVQESRAALQASITARDAVAEEIRDDILEGVAANYSLVEDGTDIEIKVFEASAETNTLTNNESLVWATHEYYIQFLHIGRQFKNTNPTIFSSFLPPPLPLR